MSDSETPGFTLTKRELRSLVADAVREALERPAQGDWVFAGPGCPLGRNQLGDAARRRIAGGLPGAGRVGRRWCLSRAALAEEIARIGKEGVATANTEPSAVEALCADLGGAA